MSELAFSIPDNLAFKGGHVELLSEEGGLVVVLFMFGTRFQGEEVMVAGSRQLLLFTWSEEEVVQVQMLIMGKVLELVTKGVQAGVDTLLCCQEEVLVILEGNRVEVKGFNCLHRETGTVFVETLLDFNTFEDFFLRCFLVSAFRELISIFRFLILSERFSFFVSPL